MTGHSKSQVSQSQSDNRNADQRTNPGNLDDTNQNRNDRSTPPGELWIDVEPQPKLAQPRNTGNAIPVAAATKARVELASRVSRSEVGSTNQSPQSVYPIAAASGWNAIGDQLTQHLQRCEQLARRGVFYSAREEANQALIALARHLDLIANQFSSEPTIALAQTALREANDFVRYSQNTESAVLKEIIDSHETLAVKQASTTNVAPLTLIQHYHQFAYARLVEAAQQHPWFSDIYYLLGRTYQAEADMAQDHRAASLRNLAVVYYRASVAISPSNTIAANQLGYVLLQMDRPIDAQAVLITAVDTKPDRFALANLAEASRRLGDRKVQDWALRTLAAMPISPHPQQALPALEMLDNRTFVAISPMNSGPQVGVPPMSAAAPNLRSTMR
ncbi:MAG: hypothetical protein KF752_19770 [Pirellulaceae bacterium]|nr:hypothetical protein [Pirellulaceae bacterium]